MSIKSLFQTITDQRDKIRILNVLIIALALLALNMSLISFASASSLDILPSRIELNGFPGESINYSLNISTSGNYLVYLNYSLSGNASFTNISMTYDSPLVVEGFKQTNVTFHLPSDLVPQKYEVLISASTEVADADQPSSSSGGGGGSGGWKTITLPNQTIIQNQTNISVINNSNDNKTQENIQTEEPNETADNYTKLMLIVVGVCFLWVLGYFVYYLILKSKLVN